MVAGVAPGHGQKWSKNDCGSTRRRDQTDGQKMVNKLSKTICLPFVDNFPIISPSNQALKEAGGPPLGRDLKEK